jgi:hypothetical protein
MAKDDVSRWSLDTVNAMRAEGKVRSTPADAPEIELDEEFWRAARIVESDPLQSKPAVQPRSDAGAPASPDRPGEHTSRSLNHDGGPY